MRDGVGRHGSGVLRPAGSPSERTTKGCEHREAWQENNKDAREINIRGGRVETPFNPINPLLILRILTICVKSVGEHRCLRYFNNGLSGLNGFVGGVIIGLNGFTCGGIIG